MKTPFKIKRKMKGLLPGMLTLLAFLFVLVMACERTSVSDYNPPADHTIKKEGYMHKTGLEQPLTNCASCHGADLEGGTVGVSCYECHGKEW